MKKEPLKKRSLELNVEIPQRFCDLLANTSAVPQQMLNERFIVEDLIWLDKKNKELRNSGFDENEWDDSFIAIGEDSGGNIWFILSGAHDSPVYFADRDIYEEGEHEEIASSIDSYVEYLKRLEKEWAEENSIPPEPSKHNILQSVQEETKNTIEDIFRLSSPNEIEHWWTKEIGWKADQKTIKLKADQKKKELILRAKESGWEL